MTAASTILGCPSNSASISAGGTKTKMMVSEDASSLSLYVYNSTLEALSIKRWLNERLFRKM